DFCLFALLEISIFYKSPLGHLYYSLTNWYFTSAKALTYSILFISFHNVKLKLSLIGFFFSANLAKPVPLAVVLLNSK
ncbi:uncharacterized protein K460DRAFT_297936, partial [Cucurbitaria berberidis CBS 394.84]